VKPYFDDGQVALYLGDCREILPALGLEADCVIADPSYEETSLEWDKWADGWPEAVAPFARSMWCFGSMRMFLEHGGEFDDAGWRLSQDIVWEKQNGTVPVADRFKRVHEHVLHWYRGPWRDVRHEVPRVAATAEQIARNGQAVRRRDSAAHLGQYGTGNWTDDGTRLMASVIKVRSAHHSALHPTQKPTGIIAPLLEYSCPPGGLVIDPFSGSGSVLEAARMSGRRAVGIEAYEPYAEAAARRLSQGVLA
jgi:site-specific DNA-methyltransferase (adenine-specific)